jgi:colanic acid/amylovoran biosynthesis glycosyltransferase
MRETIQAKAPPPPAPAPPVTVLQRCDRFVGRTMNWLYEHLRSIPRHTSVVLTDQLENRTEFPLLEARSRDGEHLSRRVWRRLRGERLYPTEALWLRRRRPKILHSHFGYVAVNDFTLHEFLEVPWIVGFYGADVYELGRLPAWREQYARMFARMELALALGPNMACELQALGCPREKIAVHALGIDVASLPNRPRELQPGSDLRVLFAGTFREKKGVEYVVRAVALARARGVKLHLTLVGDSLSKPGDVETKAAIFREIDQHDLRGIVTHRPFIPFAELLDIALASHVFVAPSVTSADGDAEGTPFVLQQMMATGMPIIATEHSDIPFIVGDQRHRLVAERDAEAIARRLEEYVEEPERLTLDGMKVRERIRTALDVRECASRLSGIYDAVGRGTQPAT